MTACPQTSVTEQVIARMSLDNITVRVILETGPDIVFPYAVYLKRSGGKTVRVEAFCQLADALQLATREFVTATVYLPS